MKRFLVLMTAVCSGLSLPLFDRPEIVQAQTPRTDTIYFMGATRGKDYNNTGVLSWCVSRSWHESYPNGPADARDEVAQQQAVPTPPPTDDQWPAICNSDPTAIDGSGKVDLTTYGVTGPLDCSSPCISLTVRGRSFEYGDGCDYIEADLYDFVTMDDGHKVGEKKGKQRMIHALAPNSTNVPYDLPSIQVTSTGLYASNEIGTLQNDTNCKPNTNPPGFTPGGYHVHHDFMPPTGSQSCSWNQNTPANFPRHITDRQKQNPSHWVHFVSHKPGVSCFADGPPKLADNLLASDGVLDGDGNGGGTRALATGAQSSLTSPQTCITGTSWCGTISVTPPVVQAAFSNYLGLSPTDYLRAQQKRIPPRGSTTPYYWYGPDNGGFYFYVFWWMTYPDGSGYWDCGMGVPGAERYWAGFSSWTGIYTCQNGFISLGGGGGPVTAIENEWSQFRGLNGINPTAPPTQQDANTWAQTQIDSGHWADVVKPALDAVIRAGTGNMDMATLGITGDPPFDGDLGQVGLAGVMNRMNTVASRVMDLPLFDPTRADMNRDWIGSTRPRWSLTGKALR